MKQLTIILSIAALLFAFGTALAQDNTQNAQEEVALDENVQPEDLGVGEPTLLPDSPFYFFKNLGRGIQSFLTFDPVKKVELKEKFANEKLMELKKMVKGGKEVKVIEKATENYQKEVEKVKEAVERIREKAEESEKVSSFLDKFIQHQALHQRVLQKLEEQVPPEAFEKIKKARETHLERFGAVMTKLEENKEQIQKRLEKNLQKVKGSEFKDFKNAEILKELEEKVPETTREAIRSARENILQRLETKVEQLPQEKLDRFKAYTETISGTKEKQAEILDELKARVEEKPAILEKIMESKEAIQTRMKVREREKAEQKPGACIQLWDPVCGNDGKTYSNECFAKIAGIEVDYKGVCKSSEELQKLKQKLPQSITP